MDRDSSPFHTRFARMIRPGAPATVLFEHQSPACTVRLVRYAPGVEMRAHSHVTDGISVVLEGEVLEEAQHRSIVASSGWIVAKPAGTVHANRFGPRGATLLAIELPARRQEVGGWRWLNDASAFRSALRMTGAMRTEGGLDTDRLIELIASLSVEHRAGVGDTLAAGVRQALEDESDNFAEPSVAALARRFGVHPVYLTRRFRRVYGMSIREYRQIIQVRRAARLLVKDCGTLSEIAHMCGFADHSHMCRSFRVVAGIRPGMLRDWQGVRQTSTG